ncbi:MAG: MarR family EPS-associated transcriptional regulator [Betaproteobacteria bacterium]|uniref:MarR family EPS-associated transcriptional regulator n=1 Tax=Ferrovum sp. PN-J185 TaxID=1356306 RepID=UPI0009ED2D73|nr:MarR family EPS-associated transcriptional regulator [Ferrovum sp. PN-J185]MDE2422934.1 MarR family EPS-associated transcriptional regulator [Betaproteobacteria bacterium]
MKTPNPNELAILAYVKEHPHHSQRVMASNLKLSLGAVNYCVQALIDRGLMKVQNFKGSQHRWKYVYVLTPRGLREKMRLTQAFLVLKYEEYERVAREIEALERALTEKG